MDDYATVRAPRASFEQARKAKREDEDWGEYLERCADAEPIAEFSESEIKRLIDERINKKVVETARL